MTKTGPIRIALAAAVAALTAVSPSCERYVLPQMTISPDTLIVAQEGGVFEVSLDINVKWTATAPESPAVTLDPDKGSGSATITVTVPANASEDPLEGRVNFKSETLSKNLVILQDGER